MAKTIVAPHGLFYMENAGGYKPTDTDIAPPLEAEEHQPSCLGEGWHGSGAMGPAIDEARPNL